MESAAGGDAQRGAFDTVLQDAGIERVLSGVQMPA